MEQCSESLFQKQFEPELHTFYINQIEVTRMNWEELKEGQVLGLKVRV